MRAALSWVPVECDDDEFDDLETEGFFHRLVKLLGRRGGRVPADLKKLAKAMRLDIRIVKRLWPSLVERFVVIDGWLHYAVVDDALARIKVRVSASRNPLKTNGSATDIDKEESSIRMEDPSIIEHGSETEPPPPSENTRANSSARPNREPAAGTTPPAGRDQHRRRRRRSSSHPTKTALSADWLPGPAEFAFAQGEGHDERSIFEMGRRFRSWHRKHGNRFADWFEAWCDWVLYRAELDKRYGDRRTRAEQRAADQRQIDAAIIRGAMRSAARRGASDQRWSQTIMGDADRRQAYAG